MASFRKVKNGWEAQVARKGARKSRTFPNKAKAQLWAAETELALFEIQLTGKEPVAGLTIGGLMRRYETEVGAGWSGSKTASAGRLISAMGEHRVADLTQTSLMRWLTDASPYAASTSEHMLRILMGGLNYARTVWVMDVSSAPIADALSALRVSGKLTIINKRDRRVSPAEEAALVANWRSRSIPPDVVAFLIDTPIRSGEMCALQWKDVDGRFVTLRDRKDPKRKIGNHQRIKLQGRSVGILAGRTTLAPFPWLQQQVNEAIQLAVRAAGLSDLHCHDLRHEGISRLFDAGWPIPQVALITGHKTWKTLERYTHVSAEDLPD